MYRAILDVSEAYRGQLFFWSDDPDFRNTSGLGFDVTPELVVINQDLAASLCEKVSRTHELSLTEAAAARLRELTDESPVSTPSFHPPFELKGYQRRAFNVMRSEPRVMLQLSAGTGKTATSLAMACDRYDRGKCGRVVVVCPSALVSDWVYNVRSLTSLTVGSVKQSWSTKRRSKFWDEDSSSVWVLNYEKLRTGDYDHIESALMGCDPLFVLDEVQKVGSRQSAVHRNLARLVKSTKAAGVIALTATPCTRGPENFYNEFRIIDYGVFGDVRSFERMFTVDNGRKDFWRANYVGFQNIPYMHVMAGAEVFSADKHRPEIAREFPDKDEQLIRYELSFQDSKVYQEIMRYGKSFNSDERCGALFYLTGRILCNMPEALKPSHDYEAMFARAAGKRNEKYAVRYIEQLRGIDEIVRRNRAALEGSKNCAKLELATEKVGELLDAGEKVVVFAQHTHNCLLPLSEHWRSWRPLLYTGEQGESERDEVKDAFKNGDRNLLLMSDAGQVGLNLQECRYLMHYDTPTSNAAYEQRSDRCVFAGASVYTPNGLVRVEDVEVGMEVLDAWGGVTRVTDTWTSESDGRAVRLQAWGSGESVDVTPDHRVLLKSGWVEAQDIPRMSETSWDYSGRCAQGAGHASIRTPDFKRFSGRNVSPTGVAYTHPSMVDMGDSLLLDEDMGFVFGYYLGDGFVRDGRCVAFALNPSLERKADAIDRICSKLSSIGFRPNRYERSETEGEAYCYGAQLAALFMDSFGTGSRGKRIPRFMWESRDGEFLRGVYDGMMASDGYRRRGGSYDEYASVSETIHVFFWWLGRMLGMRTGISRYRQAAKDRTSAAYDDRATGRKAGRMGKLKVVERVVREDRTVYDMTTESGSFVVAGIPVHNCHRVSSKFESVTVMRMMALGTVEERVEEAMQDRLAMAGEMGFAGSMSEMSDADASRLMFGD